MTERKEIPIPFSAPMVRAILDGRKTQTRRVVKWSHVEPGLNLSFSGLRADNLGYKWALRSRGLLSCWTKRARSRCPYGKPNDLLWVKEAFTFINADRDRNELCIGYDADGASLPNRPSIYVTPAQFADFMGDERKKVDPFKRRTYPAMFMNRFFSRILVENQEVRVERLRDISEEDAIAEGLAYASKDGSLYKYGIPDCDGLPGGCDIGWPWKEWEADPRRAYFKLWDLINGAGAAEANPWVWAVSFKVVAQMIEMASRVVPVSFFREVQG